MNFSINLGDWNSVFAVPSSVVDKHIKLAGSAQLKVLLWMLRHAGEPCAPEDIAAALSMDSMDVKDAMQYWVETGLIAMNGQSLTPAAESEPVTAEEQEQESMPAAPVAAPTKVHVPTRPQKADSAFVALRIGQSEEIAFLMQEAEQILARPISNGDAATLLMLHDDYGLPSDVILMMMQYAASVGKANIRYIEKMGMGWADEEIDTHEKAEQKLRDLDERGRAWRVVEQACGIEHRSPSGEEAEAAQRWVCVWKFDAGMIREAYERCVNATGKRKTKYMNSILERWRAAGIGNLAQARNEREPAGKAKSGGKKQSTYDLDAYESMNMLDE